MSKKTDLQRELMNAYAKVLEPKKTAFEMEIEDARDELKNYVADSAPVNATYGNSLLSIGASDKAAGFDKFTLTNSTLDWTFWTILYSSQWVFKTAINKPAADEIRCGISFEDETDKESVYKTIKKHRSDLIQLLQWGALYGGSIAFAMFDNFTDEDYAKPLNRDKLSKAKSLKFYVVDRWYGVSPTYDDTVTDMTSLDYGKPKYYTITFPDGRAIKAHHDYVIRYDHRDAPKLIKAGMLQGWGYAEGCHIINELTRDDKLKASIQSLVDKSLIEVIKMSGMRGVFMGADEDNEEQLRKRLEMVNWGRNFNSLTFLDSMDDYQMNTFSGLTGLSDLLHDNMWRIAAALEMQGILFGDIKGGMSGDQQALERYDETINGRCETFVRPVYNKLLKIIYAMLGKDEDYDYNFNSLLIKKHTEQKVANLQSFVGLANELLNAGVIDTKKFARAVQKYNTSGIVDFGLTDDEIDKLDEEFELASESFDIGTSEDVKK